MPSCNNAFIYGSTDGPCNYFPHVQFALALDGVRTDGIKVFNVLSQNREF